MSETLSQRRPQAAITVAMAVVAAAAAAIMAAAFNPNLTYGIFRPGSEDPRLGQPCV